MWAGTMAGVVLSQEGVGHLGHALPSSNILDDLAFGCGVGMVWLWFGAGEGEGYGVELLFGWSG